MLENLDFLSNAPHFPAVGGSYIMKKFRDYVRAYVCAYVRTYVRTCVHTNVRTYVRKYVRTYVNTVNTYCESNRVTGLSLSTVKNG